MKILLTGYPGNIGYALAEQLSHHEVHAYTRNLLQPTPLPHVQLHNHLDGLEPSLQLIIHCAASTAFRASLASLRLHNVQLTEQLLTFAQRCPDLRRFVHISTACVSGNQEGEIPEARLQPAPTAFINAYEQSKWEAEQCVHEAAGSFEKSIVRLSTVVGSEVDGQVRRPGAFHQLLYWLWKGLIPMLHADEGAVVDLISTEHATRVIQAAAFGETCWPVLHACAGTRAPQLTALLDEAVTYFKELSGAWRADVFRRPEMADADTFAFFEESLRFSEDALFLRVHEECNSFLPMLRHPRVYQTSLADSLSLAAGEDWGSLVKKVLHRVLETRQPQLPYAS
jgi:nucleoside-diphosphate-sugar epimerase